MQLLLPLCYQLLAGDWLRAVGCAGMGCQRIRCTAVTSCTPCIEHPEHLFVKCTPVLLRAPGGALLSQQSLRTVSHCGSQDAACEELSMPPGCCSAMHSAVIGMGVFQAQCAPAVAARDRLHVVHMPAWCTGPAGRAACCALLCEACCSEAAGYARINQQCLIVGLASRPPLCLCLHSCCVTPVVSC